MESGELVSSRRPSLGFAQGLATYDVRWNPTDNMVAVCTYGQPQPVMLWRHGSGRRKVRSLYWELTNILSVNSPAPLCTPVPNCCSLTLARNQQRALEDAGEEV